MLPRHATHATGGYDTEVGIMNMNTRMRQGQLLVAQRCCEWCAEFIGYHRKDGLLVKQNDDLMSATRIGVMQIRDARRGDGTKGRAYSAANGGMTIINPPGPPEWGE
jgi:hypothetical protein